MKSPIIARLALAGFLASAIPVSQALAIVSPEPTVAPTATPSAAPDPRLTALKTKGAAEIQRRLTNLNTSMTALQASTKLSPADKTALVNQVKAEISGLTALQTKLAADTTLAAARTDVQSIFTDYRVYYLMLPKTRLVTAADRMSQAVATLTDLENKLQDRVTKDKNAGKNVTAIQTVLADMQAKIADASSKSATVVPGLLALQPSDYNSNHTVLAQYRSTLQTARTDIGTARSDAQSVIASLKSLG